MQLPSLPATRLSRTTSSAPAPCRPRPCAAFAPTIALSSRPFSSPRSLSSTRHLHYHIYISSSPPFPSRQPIRANARPSDPKPSSSSQSEKQPNSSLAPHSPTVPTLFRGPEAVIGIVLAAAALLADFARSIARLTLRPSQRVVKLTSELRQVDVSIASLQSALDASKTALAQTERQLDDSIARASTAEGAIAAMDDTRAALADARRQSSDVLDRLTQVRDALREKTPQSDAVRTTLDEMQAQRDALEAAVSAKQAQLSDMKAKLDSAQSEGSVEATRFREREEALKQQVNKRDAELISMTNAREQIEKRALDLKNRAHALEEENAAASDALLETRRELQRAQKDMEERMEEWQKADVENQQALKQAAEAERLQDVVTDMEKELGLLQAELRTRDQVVENVALESDELRSLLAARDAELQELTRRLESAVGGAEETSNTLDSRKSDLNLDEVKSSLDAEQLALTAEIARAELASMELSKEDMDELVRLNLEMGAEGSLLQADLLRAESKIKKENADQVRRNEAVSEILESEERNGVDSEILEELLQSTAKEEQLERDLGGSVGGGNSNDFVESDMDVDGEEKKKEEEVGGDSVAQVAKESEGTGEENVIAVEPEVAKLAQGKKKVGRKKEGTKTTRSAAGGQRKKKKAEEEEGTSSSTDGDQGVKKKRGRQKKTK